MYALTLLFSILGCSAGFEGYDDGKYHFGIYTPTCEYGWVVTGDTIYLDTVYNKGA